MADSNRKRGRRREETFEGGNDELLLLEETTEKETPSRRERGNVRVPRLIAFSGGKGGMGASLFATNAAIYLCQMGNRVVLVDADLGMGNLHTLLGMVPPDDTLADFLNRKVDRLDNIAVETRVPNLRFVPSAADPLGIANGKYNHRQRLLSQLPQLDADYVLVDVGSGLSPHGLDLFLLAKMGVLVVTPEPTAIESCYRLLRAAFFRKLSNLKLSDVMTERLNFYQTDAVGFPGPTPLHLLEDAYELDPDSVEIIERELWRFRPGILINQARSRTDAEIGEAFRLGCRNRLGMFVELLGVVEQDDSAWISVRRRRPLLLEYVDASASRQMEQAVHRMMAAFTSLEQLAPEPTDDIDLPTVEEQDHYEVLGLSPGVTEEEIRRAHKKMKVLYADDSIGLNGVYHPEELEKIQRRLTESYDCLTDYEKRRQYDLLSYPEGHPGRNWVDDHGGRGKTVSQNNPPMGSSPKLAAVSAESANIQDSEITGEWLRILRESRGIALVDIASRTKISLTSLQWIEEENFEKMAAPVYVRGFVAEYARFLRLDAERVTRAYVDRYRAWLEAQDETR